jgi:hypothetical protein
MKYFKMGLFLAAMFVVSMVAVATASAAPIWEQCSEGGTTTKYTEHQCLKAGSGEKWAWKEVAATEEVRIKGSLRLSDDNIPIEGKVVVECSGEAVGFVGPGIHGRITEVKTSAAQCRNIEHCEKVEKIEAIHLPWQTENTEVGGKPVTILKAVTTGAGKEAGWAVTCKVLGIVEEDSCENPEGKPESLALKNDATKNGEKIELLVLATFEKLRMANCSIGGTEEGLVEGSLSILKANEWGLRVA